MTSIKTSTKTLTVASAAALLSLTACSGGSTVYDFTGPMMEPTQSIEFRVPDEVVELEEDYAETRVLESVTVSSVDSEEAGKCAVEYRFEYADGGLERLLALLEEKAGSSDDTEEGMARQLTGEDLSSIELSEDYSSAVVPLECASSPTDDEETVEVEFTAIDETTIRSFAWADITVMQDGELFVHEPKVSGWELDSNGNWIKGS